MQFGHLAESSPHTDSERIEDSQSSCYVRGREQRSSQVRPSGSHLWFTMGLNRCWSSERDSLDKKVRGMLGVARLLDHEVLILIKELFR